MTRIVHISDLHFGRTDVELLDPLVDAVNATQADLVAVTGDFTQRARNSQYRDARAFLDRFEAPWLAVPGNHDISLDNLWLRLMRPFRRYRDHICNDLFPVHRGDGFVAVGLNTVDPYRWQRGRIRWRQMRNACKIFSDSDEAIRVVLAHHPFEQDQDVKKSLMPKAEKAIEQLAECGAHLVLSGHLHRWRAEPFLSRKHGAQVLQIHVGTGLSTRLRGQENDFAVLDLEADEAKVTRMVARGEQFVPAGSRSFQFGEDGWRDRQDARSLGTGRGL